MQILRYANRRCGNVGSEHPDGTKITFGRIRFKGAPRVDGSTGGFAKMGLFLAVVQQYKPHYSNDNSKLC